MSLDLHDGPMQDLVAVGFALERLRHELTQLPSHEKLVPQVDDIRQQLVVVERSLRAMAEARADEAQPRRWPHSSTRRSHASAASDR